MKTFFNYFGIATVGGGFDLNQFMFGVKLATEEDVVEGEPDQRAFFIFIGPVYVIFIYE